MVEEGDPRYLVVGHVTKAHGIQGELYVQPLTDHPGATFYPGVSLLVTDPGGSRPSAEHPPMDIVAVRPFKKGFLLHFDGLDDRGRAEELRGRYLARPIEDVPALEEGEIFYHQILGMKVETVDGRDLGEVREVYEVGAGDLVEVRGPSGTFHVPLVAAMVAEVDVEAKRLVLDPPPGLFESQ